MPPSHVNNNEIVSFHFSLLSSCRKLTARRLVHEISKTTEKITLHIRLRNFTRIMSNINNSLLFRKSGKHIFLPILFSFTFCKAHSASHSWIHSLCACRLLNVYGFGEKLRFCWVSLIWLCTKKKGRFQGFHANSVKLPKQAELTRAATFSLWETKYNSDKKVTLFHEALILLMK